jgi:hypothetical protein
MAKVFLSYDREDTERARPVALALEQAGHAVWWDPPNSRGRAIYQPRSAHDGGGQKTRSSRLLAKDRKIGRISVFDPDLRYDCKKEAAKLAA